jgi:hypothetical protein
LLAHFDVGFKGSLINAEPTSATGLAATSELLNVSRIDTDSNKSKTVNRDAFVDWLLELRGKFADEPAPRGKFYVKTLTPPSSESSDVWTATCVHRMWGKSKSDDLLEFSLTMTVGIHETTEERLKQPGWFESCSVEQILNAKSKQTMFSEVELDQGIKHDDLHDNWTDELKAINTGGIFASDFNKDGFADLYVTDIKAGNRMYLGGSNGSFKDVTAAVGLASARSVIAGFADLNNDGWVDLVLPASGRIFRNNRGLNFQEVSQLSNLRQMLHPIPPEFISGITVADFDRDGIVDLYVPSSVPPIGSWLESRQPKIAANRMLKNNGDWTFRNVTRQTGTDGEGRSSFTAAWADVNNDRWPDLYVINEFGDGALYVNQEGKTFSEQPIVDSPPDFGSMGLASGDINNDGNLDFYLSNMYSKAGSRIMGNMKAQDYPSEVIQTLRNMVAGSQLYQNEGGLQFKAVGQEYQVHAVGWSWGSALADFDNDGWLDLHVMAGFMSRDRSKPDG